MLNFARCFHFLLFQRDLFLFLLPHCIFLANLVYSVSLQKLKSVQESTVEHCIVVYINEYSVASAFSFTDWCSCWSDFTVICTSSCNKIKMLLLSSHVLQMLCSAVVHRIWRKGLALLSMKSYNWYGNASPKLISNGMFEYTQLCGSVV